MPFFFFNDLLWASLIEKKNDLIVSLQYMALSDLEVILWLKDSGSPTSIFFFFKKQDKSDK